MSCNLAVAVRALDRRQVAHPHLSTVDGGDHRLADLLEIGVLVDRAHHELGPPFRQGATRDVDVLLSQTVDHLLGGEGACA